VIQSVKEAGKEAVEKTVKNRTGIASAPGSAKDMLDAARTGEPVPAGSELDVIEARKEIGTKADALGSVPPPAKPKGMAQAAGKMLRGENVAVLIDKLSERLAFERRGTRLYDGILAKALPQEHLPGGCTHDLLRQFRVEEAEHAALVRDALIELGGDPSVITPSADVTAVASMGLPQVLTDPRTNVRQCLEALLVAELADNDGWTLLVELARKLGREDMAKSFERALREEEVHLANIRRWVTQAAFDTAGVSAAPAE
jgi:ferritin-like protein